MATKGKKRPSAGHSKTSEAMRDAAFVEAYMTNGQNAAAAAKAAGSASKSLRAAGWFMLQKPAVKALLAERAQKVASIAEMNTENWARELKATAFSRAGELFGPDGKLIPLHSLPDHVQAALHVKVNDGAVEYQLRDKMAALNTMARHLGLFEKDNGQQAPDVRVRVELVG